MLPRTVLHKKNGHSHAPAAAEVTPEGVMLMVHSARREGGAPGRDLLRFAALIRSEKPRAFVEQEARQIDGLRLIISEALAKTQVAFDRGELSDVRATIESISAQSDAAASIVRSLMGSLPPTEAERVSIDLAALVDRTLGALRPRLSGGPALVTHIEPDLPRLMGSPRQLQQALAIFVTFVAEAIGSTGAQGRLVLEVARGEAPGLADRLVEVRISAEGPETSTDVEEAGEPIDVRQDMDLSFAAHVVTAHRGGVTARRFGARRVALVLELPAV